MCKTKFFFNLVFIVTLVMATLGNTGTVARADNGNDELRADPRLLQMAEENPDATFMVIVQKDAKNKDLPDDEPEVAVEKGGGQIKKQLDLIVSFSAELTGKELVKLARHPKVRWISADAPMVATAADMSASSVAMSAPAAAGGTTYTVSNTNDSGTGSLRQAIINSNGRMGTDTIVFNISGTGVKTVSPASALPTITSPVILDATTQPGFAGKPLIELNGTLAGSGVSGLTLGAGSNGSTVRGLVINRFTGSGIQISSNGNTIAGNWIGLDSTGTLKRANAVDGITISANNNTIGGTGATDRNVISGNGDEGVDVDPGFSGNIIIGNYVGTNATGTGALGNGAGGWAGGLLIDGSSNRIGGLTAAERNVISGNAPYGIILATGSSNLIQGNYIGTDASGSVALGNAGIGINISSGSANNIVGGTAAGARNLIANNAGDGVSLDGTAGTGNAITGNSIFTNGGLGLNLGSAGITLNDGVKTSAQPNLLMDFPVITSASLSGCGLTVSGYVGSAANQAAFAYTRVEIFKSSNDNTGYGEGQTFLGFLTADFNGNFAGNLSATGMVTGDRLTATAIDLSNNTSEFGPNYQVPSTAGSCYYSAFLSAVKADQVSLTGSGVTVAVVDSGISTIHPDFTLSGSSRIVASEKFGNNLTTEDAYGHGSHVAGIIGGSGAASGGTYRGMAPGVNLINLKTSDGNGMTYESSVVEALQWIYNNRALYNIKVVNISLNSTVAQSYHTSPLDAAVEILWFNGIVVVVSSGNNGTANGASTLYPPANDPFVITVGATEDRGTTSLGDDTVAVFSAYGTTENGFAKPDLVAPGRNLVAPLGGFLNSIFNVHPLNRVNDYYFRMTGTSMSAPVVSGAVALLLQDEPNLTPDQVKYRLMATAVNSRRSWAAYDASKTGAGYLDSYAAVNGTTSQSANTGIQVSYMLTTGTNPVTWGSVGWNSVGWNSVGWNSIGWNSVGWNSVGWNSVGWNASLWDN